MISQSSNQSSATRNKSETDIPELEFEKGSSVLHWTSHVAMRGGGTLEGCSVFESKFAVTLKKWRPRRDSNARPLPSEGSGFSAS